MSKKDDRYPDIVPLSMIKKHVVGDFVSDSLNVKAPLQGSALSLKTLKQDLHPGSLLNVPIEQIGFFDGNPRTWHDPEYYEAIKDSIRNQGVQQPVHITKRPNDTQYVLSKGGNTRLKIVQELYAETQEDRFAFLPCIFHTYISETDLLVAHMIENEQRVEMCFSDKAKSYAVLRDEFAGTQALSLRELSSKFAQHGLSVSHDRLAIMFFAQEYLLNLDKYRQSLSGPKVRDIRKVFVSCQQLSQQFNQADNFEQLWHEALELWSKQNNKLLDHNKLISFIKKHLNAAWGIDEADQTPEAAQIGFAPIRF